MASALLRVGHDLRESGVDLALRRRRQARPGRDRMQGVGEPDPVTLEDDEVGVDGRLQQPFGGRADRVGDELDGRSGKGGDHGKRTL